MFKQSKTEVRHLPLSETNPIDVPKRFKEGSTLLNSKTIARLNTVVLIQVVVSR